MKILGLATAGRSAVLARLAILPAVHQRFVAEMFDPLWSAAERYTVNPVGVVAQSGKETAWGAFARPNGSPGKVRPEFYNPAGIKVRHQALAFPEYAGNISPLTGDQPLAHAMFASWWIGALAQVQHLCAYADRPVPLSEVVDPRYTFVAGRHRCEHFAELGGSGNWAPSPTYGIEIEDAMSVLQQVA